MKINLSGKRYYGFLFLMLVGAIGFAQNNVSGLVIDANENSPLPGVNVILNGTTTGVQTDFDGKFTLISDKEFPWEISFSYVGYNTVVQTANSSTSNLRISLAQGVLLNDVVVYAQKRAQNPKDVPISISVLDGKEIQELGFYNMEIASQIIPNVNIVNSGTSPSIAVRGVSTSGSNNGFEQSVGTFVDGIYVGKSNYMKTQLFDIGQIEMLKGPQPTYFGNSTIGGALSISSVRPGKKNEGYLALSGGEQTEYDLEGAYTFALSDAFRFRVAAKYRTFDGFLNDLQTGNLVGGEEQLSARIMAVFEPSDNFTLTLKGEFADRDGESAVSPRWREPRAGGPELSNGFSYDDLDPNYDLTYNLDSFTSSFGGDRPLPSDARFGPFPIAKIQIDNWHNNEWFQGDENDIQATNLFAEMEIGLGGNYTLETLTGYSTFELLQRGDIDGSHYALFHNELNQDFDQFSQEIRLVSPGDERFNWMLGLYYQNTNFTAINGNVLPAAGSTGGGTEQDDKWLSVFANFDYSLSEKLKFQGGLRYSNVDKQGLVYSTYGISNVTGDPMVTRLPMDVSGNAALNNGEIPTFVRNFDGINYDVPYETDNIDYQANLLYEFDDENNVYFRYANGFKAGGINAPTTRITTADNPTFGDETADAFELGFKGSFPKLNMRYNLAAFTTSLQGLQVSQFDPVNIQFITTNAGEAVSRGLEFDSDIYFSNFFKLGIDVAFLNAKFTEFIAEPQAEEIANGLSFVVDEGDPNTPNDDVLGVNRTGYPLRFSPDFQFTLRPDFTFDLNQKHKIYVNAQYTYKTGYATSDVYFDSDFQDPYGELYGNIGFAPKNGKWNLNFYFRNITNVIYITTSNDANGFIGRGRRIGAQFRLNL